MTSIVRRNWIAIDSSQKRYTRINGFRAPSSLSIRRPKGNLGTYSHLRKRSSYPEVTLTICSTIIFVKLALQWTPRVNVQHSAWRQSVLHCGCRMRNALWMWKRMHCGCGNENDNSDTRGSERKIGARILQCNRFLYRRISLKWSSHVRWNSFSCPRFYLLSVCLTKTSVTHRIVG